jgi:hypothetical protein
MISEGIVAIGITVPVRLRSVALEEPYTCQTYPREHSDVPAFM